MDVAEWTSNTSQSAAILGPCLALELSWAVRATTALDLQSRHPVLAELHRGRPELGPSFDSLWADGLRGAPELLLVAHHAGALELTSYPLLRWSLDQAWSSMPVDHPLASEPPGDRDAIRARLGDLARSRARRRIYLELLGDIWSGIEQWWDDSGRRDVSSAGASARRTLDMGGSWADVVVSSARAGEAARSRGRSADDVQGTGGDRDTGVAAAVVVSVAARIARSADLPIVLVPSALSGAGMCLDLPRAVLVGFDASGGGPLDEPRPDLEPAALARRLRALADATRMTLLQHLCSGPSSVGELAAELGLAQPTVSGHIKLLRDAGIVTGTRRSGRVDLTIDRSELEDLVRDLLAVIGSGSDDGRPG